MSTLTFQHLDWLPRRLDDVYFECGVGEGNSFASAGKSGRFDLLIGCDICQRHVAACRKRFQYSAHSTSLILGQNSKIALSLLSAALAQGGRSVLFFLDSHFNGGPLDEMDESSGQCPLLSELDIILAHDWITPPILCVDDADFFTGEFWRRDPVNLLFRHSDFPTIGQIREKMTGWQEHLDKREYGQLLWFWKDAK